MKILFSIKAFLNYLYNNLIDLIWVKKIRFEDGTEMTTLPVGANIYDIKKLSQAVIDKGWTYLCNSTKQMLPKAKIPTVYNDIENKYLNCDKVPASSPANFGSLVGNSIDIDNTYLYASPTSDYKLKRTRLDGLPTLNWEIIENSKNVKKSKYRGLCVGNKIIICCFNGASSSTDICVYRKSDMTLLKTYNNPNNNGMDFYCSSIYINNVRKFVIGYKDTAQSEDTSYMVLLEDSDTLQETKYNIPYQQNCVPVYVNGYYVFMTRNYNSNRKFFIRTQNFINFENCGHYDGYSYDPVSPIYKANNKLFTYKQLVSNNDGASWEYNYSVPNIGTNMGTNNGCQKQNSFYIVNGTNVLFTDTLTTFRTVYSNANVDFFVLVNDSADMIFTQNHTNNNLFYIGYDNVVYTDTYTINGTTVNIQYYKFEDWKICISDGGTNDTNLDTIYNELGYENYWLLDRSNEQLCLPRNSNLYTQMYVGDDYLDVTVPTGVWSAVALKTDLANVGGVTSGNVITAYAINNFTNGTKDTVYQTSRPTVINFGATSTTSGYSWYLEVSTDNVNWKTIAGYQVNSGDPDSNAVFSVVIGGNLYWKLNTNLSSYLLRYAEVDSSATDLSMYKLKPQEVIISDTSITLDMILANKNYVFNSNAITDITFTACETSFEETTIEFSTGATAPTLTDNSGIVWVDGSAPTLNANKSYLIVIFNNKGFVKEY